MTQMATETTIEIETVVDDLTDHEFDIPCDMFRYTTGNCDRPARWSGVKGCCGDAALLCGDCKDHLLSTEEGNECKACGDCVAPARHAYIQFNPLGKS